MTSPSGGPSAVGCPVNPRAARSACCGAAGGRRFDVESFMSAPLRLPVYRGAGASTSANVMPGPGCGRFRRVQVGTPHAARRPGLAARGQTELKDENAEFFLYKSGPACSCARCVITNDGSICLSAMRLRRSSVQRRTWVCPLRQVNPLFIDAPNGILSIIPPYTPGIDSVSPDGRHNHFAQNMRPICFRCRRISFRA